MDTTQKRKDIEVELTFIFRQIGIDKPSNFDQILEFVIADVEDTADADEWHSGDVQIGFRRWIEAQTKYLD